LELADSLFVQKFDTRNIYVGNKQAVGVLVEGEIGQINKFIDLVKT